MFVVREPGLRIQALLPSAKSQAARCGQPLECRQPKRPLLIQILKGICEDAALRVNLEPRSSQTVPTVRFGDSWTYKRGQSVTIGGGI